MDHETETLDTLQAAYKGAVEDWISKIRHEEDLASVTHSVAEIDRWEQASFDEDAARDTVKTAKEAYVDALRQKFFGF